jgi:hypothetical protein
LYGYLAFEGDHLFIRDTGYHCQDHIRVYPHLLNYVFTPRIPTNPLEHIRARADNLPLV